MRKKIVNILFLTGFWILVSILFTSCQPSENREPNVIIIFTDDQGWADLGCYGSPNIRTPNIDRMAEEGIRFTSFYAAPFCAPSRAQLLTGCYPARVGMARNPVPRSTYGLNPDEITLAELLKGDGYATLCIGKWHLGTEPDFLPINQGFDHYFGIPFSNDMWRYHPKMPPRPDEDSLMKAIRRRAAYTGFDGQGTYYPPGGGFPNDLPLMRDDSIIEYNPDLRLITSRYTREAVSFIESNRDRPFFLYLAHTMPHVPLFASDRFRGKSKRGLYGDVIMELDWSVGTILQTLDSLGLRENTLVIFTSDNGPWLQYGIDAGSAGPFRDGKATVYEGGVRVPGIFYWPGTIQPGQRTSAVASTVDIFPTIASLTGLSMPSGRIIDGVDLTPLLLEHSATSPRKYFHYMAGSREGQVNYLGIRNERWKLMVEKDENGDLVARELYDLGRDVGEKFNRLDQRPDIVKELLSEARQFYRDLKENLRPAGHAK